MTRKTIAIWIKSLSEVMHQKRSHAHGFEINGLITGDTTSIAKKSSDERKDPRAFVPTEKE